jgi:hypothetical protein
MGMKSNRQYYAHTELQEPRDNGVAVWIQTPHSGANGSETDQGFDRTLEQRQCLANIQAVLNSYNLPSLEPIRVEPDRCNFKFSRRFLHNLANVCFEQGLFSWCSMKVVMHTPVRCYREKILRYSAKITVYGENYIEIDFDEWNPCFGTWQRAGAAFMHMLEIMRNRVSGRKSDPFKIADDLRGRGVRQAT